MKIHSKMKALECSKHFSLYKSMEIFQTFKGSYCAVRNSVDMFFFFKMSLMISFWTEILHMHIIDHHLIYNCMFEHIRMGNKSGISCKIK